MYEHIRNSAPDASERSRSSTKFVSGGSGGGSGLDSFNLGNATAFVGQTAHLHCAVENLGDRTVSEWQIPTVRAAPSTLFTMSSSCLFTEYVVLMFLFCHPITPM